MLKLNPIYWYGRFITWLKYITRIENIWREIKNELSEFGCDLSQLSYDLLYFIISIPSIIKQLLLRIKFIQKHIAEPYRCGVEDSEIANFLREGTK